jgi:predicted RNA-binding protein with PUA-like domain
LSNMALLRQSRLSVMPVTAEEFGKILAMAQ